MKRKILSILLCLTMVLSMLPVTVATAITVVDSVLKLPEDKKLVGYQQESDRAWVLKDPSESDSAYTYIQGLIDNHGYTERELLYMYPATTLSADITYYTDEAMTIETTAADGATVDGGVPDVVGTYYRKAVFTGGLYDAIEYSPTEASSPFYVVDELEGGTRRGFSLHLIQNEVMTSNGVPRGLDEPVASVDEGWSWTPAGGSTPAKLTVQDFYQEGQWAGIPIAQKAATFATTQDAFTIEGITKYSEQFNPVLLGLEVGSPEYDAELSKYIIAKAKVYWRDSEGKMDRNISGVHSLFKKISEVSGGGLILPGYEQVEIELNGTNQIGAATFSADGTLLSHDYEYIPSGISVFNYEVAPLNELLSLLEQNEEGKYIPDPRVNILGMDEKSLLLTGSGTLNVASDIYSPAGISVGSDATLNMGNTVRTSIYDYDRVFLSRSEPESVLSGINYVGSELSPIDTNVGIQGRVNIKYDDAYGIYSTGKLSAQDAEITITQSSQGTESHGGNAGMGAAYSMEIGNSDVTMNGNTSAGGAISAAGKLDIINSTLNVSGYDYGLTVFEKYANDAVPANLSLSGGDTNIIAGNTAVYASDAVISEPAINTDGVEVSVQNFFGKLQGDIYAVYAYSQKEESPVQNLSFSASSRANRIIPTGVMVGNVFDSERTITTLLPGDGSAAAALVRAYCFGLIISL